MGRKLQLTENELRNVIKRIVEQVEDEYYRISPEEYLEMMRYASYNGDVFRKMKKYGGKPLYVTGDLSLSGLPVKDVGPISYVDGRLDISNTNVLKLPDLKVKGWISDSNTPKSRKRDRDALDAKNSEMDSLRQEGAWDNNSGDETGLKAHALLEWLEGQGELTVLSEEDKVELKRLTDEKEGLEAYYDDEERDGDPDENVEILNNIEEIDDKINELTENAADVYNMYSAGSYYGLEEFEVLVDGFKDRTYSVGTEEEMDAAALEYAKNYLGDVGLDGFRDGFIDDYLDVDAIVRMAEEDYDYQIRDYPEGYFNADDFELTEEQEQRIEQLESEIEIYEERLMDIEDSDSTEYEQTQDHIDSLQEELDGIEVDTEPTEEMIENKVAEYVRDVRRDPLDYLKNYDFDIKNYVDEEALAEGLVDSDGYGIMSSYDGGYDSIRYDGIDYYIMRIN
jgi:hypothetical protein